MRRVNVLVSLRIESPTRLCIELYGPESGRATAEIEDPYSIVENRLRPLVVRPFAGWELTRAETGANRSGWFRRRVGDRRAEHVGDRLAALLFGPPERLNDVGVALEAMLSRHRDQEIVVFLHCWGPSADKRLLQGISWEMILRPNRTETLVLAGPDVCRTRHLVRIVPGRSRPSTGLLDVDLVRATLASPLEYDARIGAAFNPGPVKRELERRVSAGFLRRGAVRAEAITSTWDHFTRSPAPVVSLFVGHGGLEVGARDASTDRALLYFVDERTFGLDPVEPWRFAEQMPASPFIVLFGCWTGAFLADALYSDSPKELPSRFFLGNLVDIPVAPSLEALPAAVHTLAITGDVLSAVHALRKKYVHLSSHEWYRGQGIEAFELVPVLFYQPTVDIDGQGGLERFLDEDHGEILSLTRRIPPTSAKVGFTDAQVSMLQFLLLSEKLPVANVVKGHTTETVPRNFVRARVGREVPLARQLTIGPIRISRMPVTRWQLHQVFSALGADTDYGGLRRPELSEDLLPAEVTVDHARAYASLLGGRLARPDEWEFAAAGSLQGDHVLSGVGLEELASSFLAKTGAAAGAHARLVSDPTCVAQEGHTAFGLVGMFGNRLELVEEDGALFEMGGEADTSVADMLPQWRKPADPTRAYAFRVVWEDGKA
jgi:hypothetical protein